MKGQPCVEEGQYAHGTCTSAWEFDNRSCVTERARPSTRACSWDASFTMGQFNKSATLDVPSNEVPPTHMMCRDAKNLGIRHRIPHQGQSSTRVTQ